MIDLADVVGLAEILDGSGVAWRSTNFEEFYGKLATRPSFATLRQEIESAIEDYFSQLQLPEAATLYDALVLSLRPKDVIATFNWDPFLFDACRRNSHLPIPHVLYLHGNVRIGYCPDDNLKSLRGTSCPRCGKLLTDSKLLYPVEDKDYASDEFIAREWSSLKHYLARAFALTIFGYGAPRSDLAAVDLMREAWGSPTNRNMEEVELIDIRDEESCRLAWDPFIHSHHYQVKATFAESLLAKHPRRTVEALQYSFFGARFVELNPLPPMARLDDFVDWFDPLIDAEC